MYQLKVNKIADDEHVAGLASLVVNGEMKFNSIRLVKNGSERGFYLDMPSYRTKEGVYVDVFKPISSEMAGKLADAAAESLQTGEYVFFGNEEKDEEIKIDVRENSYGTKRADVTMTVNNDFVCGNIQIRESQKGDLFVSMPSYMAKDGTYKDYCHPIDAEYRATLNKEVTDKYKQSLKDALNRAETHFKESGQQEKPEAKKQEQQKEKPEAKKSEQQKEQPAKKKPATRKTQGRSR